MSTEGDSGIPATTEASIYETTQETTNGEPTTPIPEVAPSNAETMAAQALSKMKKQAQEIKKTKNEVAKVAASVKKAQKALGAHEKKQNQQIKKLGSQISQLQKQLAKAKSAGKKTRVRKKTKPKKR